MRKIDSVNTKSNQDNEPKTIFKDEDNDSKDEDKEDCDDSYPDVCIPSPPPDLDCSGIPEEDFTVKGSDPHRFDGDDDGRGCE